MLCPLSMSLSAQSWQDLYEQVDQYWGIDAQACIPLLESALVAASEEYGEAHKNYSKTMIDLGNCHRVLGNYDRSLALLTEARSLNKRLFGPEHELYTQALHILGNLHYDKGQFEIALPLLQEAASTAKISLGKQHFEYANILDDLGTVYQDMGLFEESLLYSIEALDVTETSEGKDSPAYGRRLNNLGTTYFTLGQYEKALELFKEALVNTVRTVGKQHPGYGSQLSNIALVLENLNQYAEAQTFLQQAIDNTEQSLGTSHPQYGLQLNRLAHLLGKMQEFEQAIPLYVQANANLETSVGKQHRYYEISLTNLALAYQHTDNHQQARSSYLELLDLLSHKMTNQLEYMSEASQEGFFRMRQYRFDQASSFLLSQPHASLLSTSLNQLFLRKAYLQNQRVDVLQGLRSQSDSNIQKAYIAWDQLHRILAQEFQKPPSSRLPDFDSLRNRANELETQLMGQSIDFKRRRQQVIWQEVQAALQEGEAAIEFAHVRYYDKIRRTDSVIYLAYIIRPEDSVPLMRSLFEEGKLRALLSLDHTPYLASPSAASRGIRPKKVAAVSSGLKDLIWNPLEDVLQGTKTVYFSPSGLLHRLNVSAIPVDKKRYLGDVFQLIQLGSTRSLVFDQPLTAAHSPRRALLMGGIQYDKKREESYSLSEDKSELSQIQIMSRGRTATWEDLPATVVEVQSIQHLLRQHGMEVRLLRGSEASEPSLKQMTPSPHILHIATHGYFFPDPRDSVASHEIQLSDHPMVRSGLILAGANHAWQGNLVHEGQEDGILTAYEISRMDLSQTELVVLSACETGLGDIEGNEGVYGLQRAFKIAGAKYILMSLWQVPDLATQELMTAFYENWLGGMEIRAALQTAQKTIRKTYKEPYYWAGFVLVE
ncbi:MAG: CHAT domain-containing tetratricopeptide repeat protein [Bacteroidota bacterium]